MDEGKLLETLVQWLPMIWLLVAIIFGVIEAATVQLMSIWFAVGALGAILVALTGGGLAFQVVVFLTVSILLLASLRGLVRKHFTPRLIRTNVDSVLGSVGVVTTPVNNIAALGRVVINGMEWSARSTTGSPLPEGAKVKVDKIEGVKVFVSLAETEATV